MTARAHMTLAERIRDYLQRQDDWVPVSEVVKKAKQHNYSSISVDKAMREINEHVDIGLMQISYSDRSATLPPGSYIRLYPMTEEEKRQRREVLQFFEDYAPVQPPEANS